MPVLTYTEAIAQGKPISGLQTVLLPKAKFSKEEAKKWLKDHKYKYGNYRTSKNSKELRFLSAEPNEAANFHRFMQINPIEGATYYTEKLPNGVELVFMKEGAPEHHEPQQKNPLRPNKAGTRLKRNRMPLMKVDAMGGEVKAVPLV